MAELYIPACGDRIILEKDWTFDLTLEHRNVNFAVARGLLPGSDKGKWGVWEGERYGSYKKVQVILPAGTTLECDRVYIRTFSKAKAHDAVDNDFDSITWKVMNAKGKPERNQRFWAKLSDVNGLEYRQDNDGRYRDRIKLVREIMDR